MTLQELLKDNFKENMTAEEIAKALESVEPSEPAPENLTIEQLKREAEKWKNAANKASKEAAEQKRLSQARMTEEEVKAAELKVAQDELRERVAELEREKKLVTSTTKLLASGMPVEMAEKAAVAFTDGDMDNYLLLQKQHQDQLAKTQRAEALKTTPKPNTASAAVPKELTSEQFANMGYKELVSLKRENPDLYNELSQNGG